MKAAALEKAVLEKAAVLAVALLAGGCAIDTELGLAVEITSASADVTADPAGDVVSVIVDVEYRTGAHATEAHELRPQSIDVFAEDAPVATLSPNRPPVFVPRVAPGETRTTTLTAESAPGAAADPRRLCGAEARVLFRWIDDTTGEVGMTEATTSPVTCD